MKPESHIPFLQQKIQDIRSALFYSLSSAVLKLPSTIVNILKVDEAGNIWFLVTRPLQQLEFFEREFPAKMQFYRKGKGCHLDISGQASIIADPEDLYNLTSLPDEAKTMAFSGRVLIRVKIDHADYYEYKAPEPLPKSYMSRYLTRCYQWLMSNSGRSGRFSLHPSLRMEF